MTNPYYSDLADGVAGALRILQALEDHNRDFAERAEASGESDYWQTWHAARADAFAVAREHVATCTASLETLLAR